MKKLLTVSLVAVMAVSAAHAKIASTDYVDDQVSPVATKVGSAEFSSGVAASHKGNVTAAIDAVAAAVAGLSSGDGSVASQIATAKQELQGYADGKVKELADGAVQANTTAIATEKSRAEGVEAGLQNAINDINNETTGVLAQAKGYADGLAGNYDAKGSATTAETNAKTYTDNKVKTLNGVTGTVAADGNYVVQTTEANGIVTVSRQAFDTTISNEDNAQHSTVTAPTTKAVATYVADQIGTVATQTNSVQEKLDQIYKRTGSEATGYEETGVLPQIQKDLQDQIDAIEDEENGVLAQAQAKIDALDATVAVEANSNKFVTGVVEQNGVLTSVQSSTINAAVVALADVPEACAAGGQKKCALSVQNGDFSWEVIEP